jgi:hypothetical protein
MAFFLLPGFYAQIGISGQWPGSSAKFPPINDPPSTINDLRSTIYDQQVNNQRSKDGRFCTSPGTTISP